jgi:hypothetical protein
MVEFNPNKIKIAIHYKKNNPLFCICIGETTDKVVLSKFYEVILFRICLLGLDLVLWKYNENKHILYERRNTE